MGQGWGHSLGKGMGWEQPGGQCWAMRKCQFIFFQKHFPGSAGATEEAACGEPWSWQAWALTGSPGPLPASSSVGTEMLIVLMAVIVMMLVVFLSAGHSSKQFMKPLILNKNHSFTPHV